MQLGDQLISCLLMAAATDSNSKNYHFGGTAATEPLLQDPPCNAILTRTYETKALLAIDTCSQLSAASVV